MKIPPFRGSRSAVGGRGDRAPVLWAPTARAVPAAWPIWPFLAPNTQFFPERRQDRLFRRGTVSNFPAAAGNYYCPNRWRFVE